MLRKKALALFLLGFVGSVLVCQGAIAQPRCIPGQSVACACVTGATGAQVCIENGAFAPCVCASQGAAPDKDCSGRWKLGEEDNVLLARNASGKYEIRNEEGYGGPWYSKVNVTVSGSGCRLRYLRTEGMQGYNTEASYDLQEIGGVISGKALVKNEDLGGNVKTDKHSVAGSIVPLKAADTSFSSETVTSDFPRFVETLKESCKGIPESFFRSGAPVSVKVVVAKNGGVAKLFLNGADMHVQKRCTTHISENKSRFFPNYSGKEQTVSFTYTIP
jgi:hypothetical protein